MPQYTCDPAILLNGHTVYSLLANMRADALSPLVKKYGLADIEKNDWYPLQDVLHLLSELKDQGTAMMDFVAVGMSAADLSPFPPELEKAPLEQILLLYPQAYPARHRNGVPGSVVAEKVAEGHIKMICDVPYPDDIFYGLMYGFARRFLPRGTDFTVRYDETEPRKEEGGPTTIIHVSWN